MTTTFEQGFADAERSAVAVATTGSAIIASARQMQQAAQQGDITKLRKATEKLANAVDSARQAVANAQTSWPFSEKQEREYLTDSYEAELLEEGARTGLTIYRHDTWLVAFPSIIRILASELSIRIDRKRIMAIRPSYVVRVLLANQTKNPRYSSKRFLEALFSAYRILVGKGGTGKEVLLTEVYQMFTLLPDADIEYKKSDFARDVYVLDRRSGITETSSRARLSLPASTGTKDARKVITFVGPDGQAVKYYGLRFTEP